MSDNVEYQFQLYRGGDNWYLDAHRRVYADAGPDAVGDILFDHYFNGVAWTAEHMALVITPGQNRDVMREWFTQRALKAAERG